MTNVKTHHLLQQAIISDIALGFEPEIEVAHKWDLLPRYRQAGFSYVGLAVAGDFTNLEQTVRYVARQRAHIEMEPDKYIIVERVADIVRAKQENKLALGFWLQGSAPLANDIHMIATYYRLGIRYILLAYNTRNAIGDGVIEQEDAGLSAFGLKVIEEMNRVGMIIDLSHAGYKTSMAAMEASCDPVIFSHSNADKINPHIRNLKDEQIIALGRNGGVIGVNGMAMFLGTEPKATSKRLVDHIEYLCDLAGVKHVGLGLDLVYFHEILDLFYQKAGVTTYAKKGYVGSMDSLQPEKIAEVIEVLLQRNFTDEQIIGILGGNFLRVASNVWQE